MATAAAVNTARFLADQAPPYAGMSIGPSFGLLTEKEKLYAHWLSRASWEGARVIMNQWTPYAEKLYNLIVLAMSSPNDKAKMTDLVKMKEVSGVSDADWTMFLEYVSQVLSNLVNYKSFGGSKFIPRISSETFGKILKASPNAEQLTSLWNELKVRMWSLEPESELLIGKPSAGHISNYYLGKTISDEEVDEVQKVCEKLSVDPLNTRVKKVSSSEYIILIASAEKKTESHTVDLGNTKLNITVQYGDFSGEMSRVAAALKEAKKYAANAHQEGMLDGYIASMETGDMKEHRKGSIEWVKDVGPVVESYIGFIETYVDPFGARAEWEGFTAIVNKDMSAKYEKLVAMAPSILPSLPWGKAFEVDVFKKPDFTALEVLNFATGGIPAGINIPNYYEVRESQGFKNVSLANILAAKTPNDRRPFVAKEDFDLCAKYEDEAFNVQVANHELLGHGSGKLMKENEDGTKNFDPEKTINPLTGKPVDTWYKPGQTYGQVLGTCSSSFEECRAEAAAMYLVFNRDILKLFGHTEEQDIEDLQYISYLIMARAGIRALEFYDVAAKKHLQAHMQARMGLLLSMIQGGIARLEEIRSADGTLEDLIIRVDRQAVLKNGKDVFGKVLVDLQIRKSIADGEGARAFYEKLTNPPENWLGDVRDMVLKKKQPRKIFVQPNTVVENGKAVLKEYPLSAEGTIQSFIERAI
ncbi:aflatoxin-detoxifizyme [Dacryopinax primogenitus]|uniref:Dipeptidyl peptidase 3 n=1 Tax=Dacryopinax primogenitus (strain DJM 731) TaxID=1858805 RepID=M5FSU7_DACPD|nr:aflatoxin-detoxifizyme [Dacryopinax primogenitus]EJT99028.1 aflatoxin-detoxifizyme [Dacryopinax primogenitus]